MAMPHPEASHFQASVIIAIAPVNKYGDKLEAGGGTLTFKVPMTGKLSDILARVEAIMEGEPSSR